MLVIDGIKYRLWTPKDEEKEFHPMVKEHSKEIFGEDSIYFDIKHKLTSKSGIAVIPDAYVILLSKPYEWFIVENELSSHPVYSHIVPQVSKFVDSIEELETQRDIRNILDEEINQDEVLKAYIEKKTKQDTFRFLSGLLYKPPKIALIIDEITMEVDKASKSLKKLANTKIVEFKTFVREDAPTVRAHLFEPLYEYERLPDKRKEEERKYPPHRTSWEKRLEWVTPSVKTLVTQLISKIEKEFPDANHFSKYRWYYIYKGKSRSTDSLFVVLMLKKKEIKIRIRTDPQSFKDEKNWTRSYKGWFFKRGEEREFSIRGEHQFSYGMELIKQSYDISGEKWRSQWKKA